MRYETGQAPAPAGLDPTILALIRHVLTHPNPCNLDCVEAHGWPYF